MAGKTKQTGKSPRTRAANDEALSSDSTSTQAFAARAKDLGALREAIVDAAGVGTGLWLSYLFLFFYLFVAVAAVTHKDLFFENPVKLPFLNVELPLIGFFWLGPLLFLILHAYVLLHLSLLAGKVDAFHDELQAQITDVDTRARLRRQLPSNIFVQYLAGPHEVRTGFMGLMLRAIAIITLIVFPVALLVFFQLQFLPYHSAPITWWHRIAVLIDIILLWRLWPSIALGQAKRRWHDDLRHPSIVTLAVATFVSLLLVFTSATFPGEWLDSNLPSLRLVPTKLPSLESEPTATDQRSLNDPSSSNTNQSHGLSENEKETQPSLKERWRKIVDFAKERWWNVVDFAKSMEWTSLHDLLVAGDVDLVARKPRSLWSNRLVLPGVDVIDHAKFDSEEKIEALRETFSLRGRRLEGAVLIGSGLRKVDFTGARLQGAELEDADLREASIGCAEVSEGEERGCAQLQRVSLSDAQLQGADLRYAQLQDAYLTRADFRGAQLRWAELQGANLDGAQLQGADLLHARLEGANLSRADLAGADLRAANLWGADLSDAQLQGADLQGAAIWLASFPVDLARQAPAPLGIAHLKLKPPAAHETAELQRKLQNNIYDLDQALLGHLWRLNQILQNDGEQWEDADRWSEYVGQAKDPSSDETVEFLTDLACGDSLGHIANNMALRAKYLTTGLGVGRDYAKPLAQALLNENCKGAKALSHETRAMLENLVSETEGGN